MAQRQEAKKIGQRVTVYDRYLFAVPVMGYIIDVSEKDGAYSVMFFPDNPGGQNVTKHNGKFFHYQQCRVNPYKKNPIKQVQIYKTIIYKWVCPFCGSFNKTTEDNRLDGKMMCEGCGEEVKEKEE